MEALALRKVLGTDPAVLDAAIDSLVGSGEVTKTGALLGLASHRVAMSPEQEALAERALTLLAAHAMTPPEVGVFAQELGVGETETAAILSHLADRGETVPIGEQLFAHRDAAERAQKLLVDWLREHGQIGVVDYRDQIDASRKYVYAWLDHFDRRGITYRVENLRYLREGALEDAGES
jgi:selenocysteine-specific elongation factor